MWQSLGPDARSAAGSDVVIGVSTGTPPEPEEDGDDAADDDAEDGPDDGDGAGSGDEDAAAS